MKKVKEVLEAEGNSFCSRTDLEGHTFVHWAALGGHHELIDFLVEKGAPLNNHSKNDYGPLPIHFACVHGHIMTIEYFLDKGVAIDAADLNGCSPLLVSAQYGESLCVTYLLQKGANKFLVDINGDSALHWASFKGRWCGQLGFYWGLELGARARLGLGLGLELDNGASALMR